VVINGAIWAGRTTPAAMMGAPIANATSRRDSARSGRRFKVNSVPAVPSNMDKPMGMKKIQNAG
jgi:hypothetical protein